MNKPTLIKNRPIFTLKENSEGVFHQEFVSGVYVFTYENGGRLVCESINQAIHQFLIDDEFEGEIISYDTAPMFVINLLTINNLK